MSLGDINNLISMPGYENLLRSGTNTLTIISHDEYIQEGDKMRPGMIADFCYDGKLVHIEEIDTSIIESQKRPISP